MQLTLSTVLAMGAMAALLSATSVQGLGINCRGSIVCRKNGALADIASYISDIQPARIYGNGEHIACRGQRNGIIGVIDPDGGVCAFLQHTGNGLSGAHIEALINYLVRHGCNSCGSVPINFPESNDPGAGILTVNFVSNTANICPNGLC